jgi:deazaflavin-dependent oxidoreductase (nitroreductase family)
LADRASGLAGIRGTTDDSALHAASWFMRPRTRRDAHDRAPGMANPKGIVIMATLDSGGRIEHDTSYALRPSQRFWRNRRFARLRHRLVWLRRSSPLLTRAHARLIRWTGGRIRRSFVFTGGMPLLVLTTAGRKSGKRRSTPLGYLRFGNGYAVIASNAGSDRVPAWWLNLQADPEAQVLADRTRYTVRARRATAAEDDMIWAEFARLNPGFDEYRSLTERPIPVVILEKSPTASASNSLPR